MREISLDVRSEPGSRVRVRVLLPDAPRWNGRLLVLGNGGGGGKTPDKAMEDFARAGWATVGSDAGTAPNPAVAGIGNVAVWRDFGHRATHVAALEARRSVRSAFGREPKTSAFWGESTGGEQALAAVQRHPEEIGRASCRERV